jgi:hypothetical protein
MEGLLSEFAAPLLTRKTHCRVRISLFPSQRQAHGTSVDIENSVALRATHVKARSKREAIVIDKHGQCIAPAPRWDAISNGRFGVTSGHGGNSARRLLSPRELTSLAEPALVEKCQERSYATCSVADLSLSLVRPVETAFPRTRVPGHALRHKRQGPACDPAQVFPQARCRVVPVRR